MNISRLLKVVIPAVIIALLAGCRTAPIYNVSELPIHTSGGGKPSMEQVENSIVAAATSLGWSIKRIEAGKLVATLNVRTHRAVVDISFNSENFSITYKDSENLRYDGTNIHNNYNGWIQRLEDAIRSQLNMQ